MKQEYPSENPENPYAAPNAMPVSVHAEVVPNRVDLVPVLSGSFQGYSFDLQSLNRQEFSCLELGR